MSPSAEMPVPVKLIYVFAAISLKIIAMNSEDVAPIDTGLNLTPIVQLPPGARLTGTGLEIR